MCPKWMFCQIFGNCYICYSPYFLNNGACIEASAWTRWVPRPSRRGWREELLKAKPGRISSIALYLKGSFLYFLKGSLLFFNYRKLNMNWDSPWRHNKALLCYVVMINIWKCRFQRRWPTCNCKNINFRCKGFRPAKRAAIHKQCIAMVSLALRIINIIHSGFSECWLFLHFYSPRSRNLQRKKKLTGCTSFWERFHIFSGCFEATYKKFPCLQKLSWRHQFCHCLP